MRKREVFVIFLLLFVTMAVFTIPLWWNYAQPYIFAYIQGVIREIREIIDLVLSGMKQR